MSLISPTSKERILAALQWRCVNEWICCFQSKHVSILNSEHIIIILVIFTLILSGMCFAFVFNCTRKLIRDHRIMKVSAAPTPISFISLSLTRRAACAVLNGRALEWNLILLTHPLKPNRTLSQFPTGSQMESTQALRKFDFWRVVTYLWNINLWKKWGSSMLQKYLCREENSLDSYWLCDHLF